MENFLVFSAFAFVALVLFFIYKQKKVEEHLKKHGVIAAVKSVEIKRSAADIKVSGEYEYQLKTYKFYKELEPLRGQKNEDYNFVKTNPNAVVKIKIDPAQPRNYVLLFE